MPSPETPPLHSSTTTRRVPIIAITGWREDAFDVAACPHPVIVRFAGAVSHVEHRCLFCDRRVDVTEPMFTQEDVQMLEYVGQYGFPAVKNAYPTVEQWQSLIDRLRTQIRP